MASKPSLCDKAISGIDNLLWDPGCSAWKFHPQLRTSVLMAKERRCVKVSLVVETYKSEVDPNDGNRLTILKLHRDIGHAHSISRETRQTAAPRVSEDLGKFCVWQSIQAIVLVEQKHSK